jgi:Ig-like domain from next to BRCA1 gene
MKRTEKMYSLVFFAVLGGLLLSACGPATPEPSPTPNPDVLQTAAVSTFSAGLTQTAFVLPSDTPIPTPIATLTPIYTFATPTPPASSNLPPAASCYGLTFVKDVTIPDNTLMAPGQAFTKTWRVRNSGTCPWDKGFKFTLVSGNAMSGATLVLDSAVTPGVEKDLSIAMKAPTTTGSARGTWRMSTASGTSFGDQVFVLINVGGTITVTPTPTSKTPTVTTTARTPTHTTTATVTGSTPTATFTTAPATATNTTAPATATNTTEPPTSTPTPSETPVTPTETPT